MPPIRPLTPTSSPHLDVMLTDDGSRTLRHRTLGETFHSGCGALSECWYVYLLNSGIHELLKSRGPEAVRVLEVGFGTGMGWLLTAAAAEVYGTPLEYVSLEKDLLPADVLAQIDTSAAVARGTADGWIPESFAVINAIERAWLHYRQTISSSQKTEYRVSSCNHLQLILGDARAWLSSPPVESFDAIYFDAFSPDTNPELWQGEIFSALKKRMRPSGKLVSYCVSGAVRRAFQNEGFEVKRLTGPPGGKREVLLCTLAP